MFVNKIIQGVFLFVCVLVLSSCGGGGTNSNTSQSGTTGLGDIVEPIPFSLDTKPDGVDSTYQGKKTPAQLTQEQSLIFLKTLFGFSLSSIDLGNTVSASGRAAKSYARQVNFTENGLFSGSYRITGDVNQHGGVLTAVWNNYSDAEGSVMNGKVIFNIVGVNYAGDIYKSTTRYVGLTIKDKQQDVLINGYTIEQDNYDNGYNTTIYDVSIQDKKNGKWIGLDKLKVKESGRNTHKINGRLYSSDLGYVDIVTPQTFDQCLECEPAHPVQGKLSFNDAYHNVASFTFTPGRDSANKIDLVLTKKGQNETEKKTLGWRDFALWKHENRLPRIANLYDPPFFHDTHSDNYIDSLKLTFTNREKYYDDDGDKVTLSYDWYVNGQLITTNHTDTLSVPAFKAGDDIKIKITADDGYHQVTKTITGQQISDTRSVISIKPFPEIIVGKEFILDATDTYDADDGELSYKWTIGDPGVGSWVQVDDAIIAERDKIKTSVKFLESGSYELTLHVTQNKAQGDPTITDKRITFQVKDDTERFSPVAYYPHPVSKHLFLSLGDVTGDDRAEILLTFKDKKEIAILNELDSYEPMVIKLDKQVITRPQVRDINADGRKDILVLHQSGVSLLMQNPQGGFKTSFIEIGWYNQSMISGDFNHDGLTDIAVLAKSGQFGLSILFQKAVDTEGMFFPALTKKLTKIDSYYDSDDPHLTVTDFNHDGKDDIMFWAYSELDSSDRMVLMLSDFSIRDQNANSQISTPPEYVLSFKQEDVKLPEAGNGEQINDIVFADINNDNKLDTLEFHTWERDPYFYVYYRENAQFNTRQRRKNVLSKYARKMAVADFDLNNKNDIYYLSSDNTYDSSLVYHLTKNGKPGTSRHRIKLRSDPRPDFADIGDIDGDGKNDIVILYPDKFGVLYAK
jgi:hypothetical protein